MQSDSRKIGDKVIRNTAYNIFGRIWFLVIGFFLAPYVVGHLGVERYAVWALVGVVTNYFGLLDFGVGSSFVKYVSEFYTTRDQAGINKLVNTGFGFYAALGAVILAATVLFIGPLLSFLKIPVSLYGEARFVFILAVGVFCASNAMGVFMAVQTGLQRMDLSNKINIAASVVTVAGTIFFLEKGYGLRGLMVNNAVVFALTSAMYILSAYRLLPHLAFRPFAWDRPMFRRIFSFGFRVQISRISGTITSQTDKILITYFLVIGLVTYYQLGSTVVACAMSIPALLVSALVPAFSEIEARGERKKLIESYLRSTKYFTFFTVPLFVFIAAAARRIMFIWMGLGYEQSVMVIQILAAAYVINMIARVSGALCMAIEKPEHMANASIIMIVLNIGLSVFFIKTFGFPGVAWGTLVAVNAGTVYFLWKLHRNLGIPAGMYMRVTAPFFAAGLVAALFVYGIDAAVRLPAAGLGRLGQLA
ncbi:MAG: flippase, partial [Candidatus Omnitrophota bacterium]